MGTPIMDTVQNIILDVSKGENQARVSIKKGDANKWLWRFCLVDDGQPLDLSWAKSACFRAEKPDGKKIWNPCVIRGNVVEYTVTGQTTAEAGTLTGEVELTGGYYDSDGNVVGEKLTSACFTIQVLEHTVSDGELTSENEFGALDEMQAAIAALDDKFPVQAKDLAAGVKEKLQNALVKKQVDELPEGPASPNGEEIVLGKRSKPCTYHMNGKNQTLLTTNWLDLDAPADLTPLSSSKRFRAVVILTRDDGQTIDSTFHDGALRFRSKSSQPDEVEYSLSGHEWKCGYNQLDFPVTDFSQSYQHWDSIDQVTVFLYKTGTVAATMKVESIEFVDTSVGIAENAIYIVPSDDPKAGDAHDEYMYIDGGWERIGGRGRSGLAYTADIADGAVTTPKLADGAVIEDKLAAGAVTADKLADRSVRSEKIAAGSVTPEKTSFVQTAKYTEKAYVAHFYITMGSSGKAEVESLRPYLLYDETGQMKPPQTMQIQYYNSEDQILSWQLVTNLPLVRPENTVHDKGWLVTPPSGTAKLCLAMIDEDVKPIYYALYSLDAELTIPGLRLEEGSVGLAQLSDEAAGRLNGALHKIKTDTLPPGTPAKLGERTQSYTGVNTAGSNLLTTNWIALDGTADLTPLAASRHIRMKVTLSGPSGQSVSFNDGQIQLRDSSDDANQVKYSLANHVWKVGENTLDIPLTAFAPADSPSWQQMNQVMVYVYASSTTAGSSITVSEIALVDLLNGIDENAIYIVPSDDPKAGDEYDEYTFIDYKWEKIGGSLADGEVTTQKLADGAVTAEKLADGVLDSAGVVQTGTATLTCTSGAASEKFDCSYCKIGNMVTLRGSGYTITTTWGTGVTFTGLPFPCQGVSGFVWKSTSSAGFWGFGYLSGSSLNICKEIAYSPYEGSKTDLTGPYDGTGFTVTYITGS